MCLTKQTISDFYRDPQLRVTLDVEKLARLFDPWPQMEYRISHCSNVCFSHYMEEEEWYIYFSHMDCYLQILLPYSFLGHFILFLLDMKSRIVSILDPMPIPHTFKGSEPTLYYVHKIKKHCQQSETSDASGLSCLEWWYLCVASDITKISSKIGWLVSC